MIRSPYTQRDNLLMATKRPVGSKSRQKKYGLSSKILDTIRSEVQDLGVLEGSDYYAKQANPKDGGYAKSNYITGDGYSKADVNWGVIAVVDPATLAEAGVLSQVAGAADMQLKVKGSLLKSALAKARKGEAGKR